MRGQEFFKTVQMQRDFFNTQKTKDIQFRLDNLKKLKSYIIKNERKIADAINKDLKRSRYESYMVEIGVVLEELSYAIKKLKSWAKPKRVKTSMAATPGSSYVYPDPYGVVVIMAPWNYPFLLLMSPFIGALAAGNTVILKPGHYSSNTSKIIYEIMRKCFKPEYVVVVEGGRDVNEGLMSLDVDYFFFTGSSTLGKIVMEAASKTLTPVTLELGGKSPVIVDKDANIDIAAKRIAWGKHINAGQSCIAPDYLLIHKEVKQEFIESYKKYLVEFYGDDILKSKDYPRIINEKHFKRITALLEETNITYGGESDLRDRFIAPTIIENPDPESPIMQEEIFGPILPIIEFEEFEEVITFINARPKPLACYYFTRDSKKQKEALNVIPAGAILINDIMMQGANPYIPFGGVGNSGMGSYHGKFSFDTFTHYKAVYKKSNIYDSPLRYAPFKDKTKFDKLKKLLK